MTNKEMRLELRKTRKMHEIFTEKMKEFAKRSKYISINTVSSNWGYLYVRMECEKKNKVVEEMLEYISSLCKYVETEEDGWMYFRNFEEHFEDFWALEYDITVVIK